MIGSLIALKQIELSGKNSRSVDNVSKICVPTVFESNPLKSRKFSYTKNLFPRITVSPFVSFTKFLIKTTVSSCMTTQLLGLLVLSLNLWKYAFSYCIPCSHGSIGPLKCSSMSLIKSGFRSKVRSTEGLLRASIIRFTSCSKGLALFFTKFLSLPRWFSKTKQLKFSRAPNRRHSSDKWQRLWTL